jgi:hypothetical protein
MASFRFFCYPTAYLRLKRQTQLLRRSYASVSQVLVGIEQWIGTGPQDSAKRCPALDGEAGAEGCMAKIPAGQDRHKKYS